MQSLLGERAGLKEALQRAEAVGAHLSEENALLRFQLEGGGSAAAAEDGAALVLASRLQARCAALEQECAALRLARNGSKVGDAASQAPRPPPLQAPCSPTGRDASQEWSLRQSECSEEDAASLASCCTPCGEGGAGAESALSADPDLPRLHQLSIHHDRSQTKAAAVTAA